ncbi:Clathrin heavy chain [Triticum urartu]|uniref:Clathrin heavy chain n=1 Tax=Triticum urartu TaxID=4572 RepID=M7ZQX7_TRIUA|nr:Clathrin heavy chain [Triticum urartu]
MDEAGNRRRRSFQYRGFGGCAGLEQPTMDSLFELSLQRIGAGYPRHQRTANIPSVNISILCLKVLLLGSFAIFVLQMQSVPVQDGQTPPLNKKNLLENWLAEDKLECSEELGDLVKMVDNDLALKIYIKAMATPKVVTAFAERRDFDKILIYSKQALVEFFGTLSKEWALECMKDLLLVNLRGNLQIVVQILLTICTQTICSGISVTLINLQKVNPGNAPLVVGQLLDDECTEDFIKGLILSVRSLLPVEPLVDECEKRRGQCDEELVNVTNKNLLFKLQARYVVERMDGDLWDKVLQRDNEYRRQFIDQVVSTALPESKSPEQNSAFSGNFNLQNLLILIAIKADSSRVMDIERDEEFAFCVEEDAVWNQVADAVRNQVAKAQLHDK